VAAIVDGITWLRIILWYVLKTRSLEEDATADNPRLTTSRPSLSVQLSDRLPSLDYTLPTTLQYRGRTMPTIVSPEGNPFSGLAAMSAETAVLYEAMRFVYVLAIGVSTADT
jgi:hypothetical protein